MRRLFFRASDSEPRTSWRGSAASQSAGLLVLLVTKVLYIANKSLYKHIIRRKSGIKIFLCMKNFFKGKALVKGEIYVIER